MAETEQRPVVAEPRAMGPRPAVPVRGAVGGMTPKEILAILRRHWFMIIFMTVFGFGVGAASWFVILTFWPDYTAQAFIRVLPPIEKDPTLVQGIQVSQDIQYGYRLSISMLLKSQSMLQDLIDRDKVQQTKYFKSFGNITADRIRKAVKDLKKYLQASAQRDGDSIMLSMTCHDKEESALIVNEMGYLFVSNQGGAKRKDVADKLAQLEIQQVRVQRDLDQAEKSMDDIRRRYGFADLKEHNFQPITDSKLNDLELQQDKLVMDISELRTSIERLAIQAEGPVQVQVERQVETDPVMTLLAEQLSIQESQLASALARFGEDHRIVRQTQEYISSIQEERLRRKAAIAEQTRQSNLKNAQDQLITMQGRLEELERRREEAAKRKEELDLARAQFEIRLAIRDERKMLLDSIKEQIEKQKIIYDDPETPKVQFVSPAPEPLEVSFPRWEAFFPGGAIMGLLLGVGIAFLIEVLNDLVRTPKDVTTHLHIQLLGMIPDADVDEQLEDIELALVVRQAPNSITSESYRRMRTNLKLSALGETKTMLISSGGARDGKTSVAVNLATTFVTDGSKVLLIDANFRRPRLQAIFAAEQAGAPRPAVDAGLSNLLAGQCDLQNAIRPSGMEHLDIIESGAMPANPAEMLGGEAMERLIKQQRVNYDYVIIDGPPVLLTSEAKILARCVDGTILVFNAQATRRGTAARTISELKQVNAVLLGCVLLGVKTLKGGYFRELFKSYQEYQALEPAKA
jgi:capsular exopolysaccharide synthesis family protein